MLMAELLAREAIRDLLARYTYNGDRGRIDALAACFADDGVLEFPGHSGTGPAGVKAALTRGERRTAHRALPALRDPGGGPRGHVLLPRV